MNNLGIKEFMNNTNMNRVIEIQSSLLQVGVKIKSNSRCDVIMYENFNFKINIARNSGHWCVTRLRIVIKKF